MTTPCDLVLSICGAWQRGDFDSTDWADPEIEYSVADAPGYGTWRGVAGMNEGGALWLNVWASGGVVVEDCREVGEGRVLVLLRSFGQGTGAAVFELHDDKVTRLTVYFEQRRAIADLALAD